MLTNIARALKTAAKTAKYAFPIATPLSEAVAALMSLFGTVTQVAAKTPIIDAGVALVPGLAGQSRESANAEILRLCKSFRGVPLVAESRELLDSYYFVQSDFQPEDPGWKFRRRCSGPEARDTAAITQNSKVGTDLGLPARVPSKPDATTGLTACAGKDRRS